MTTMHACVAVTMAAPPSIVSQQSAPSTEQQPRQPRRSRFDQPAEEMIDWSRPPPNKVFTDDDLRPIVMYYDLPAALMVPLIAMTDKDNHALDPTALRLPPPAPPSARLLAAVEQFYAPPTNEKPRDADGWEKMALQDYYREKQRATQVGHCSPSSPKTGSSNTSPPRGGRVDPDDSKTHVRRRKSKWDS